MSFMFEGTIQEITKEISLNKGIFHMITKLLFDVFGIMGDTLSEILGNLIALSPNCNF